MNDRLDDKIRGFVAELVNDPPTTPEIDFEARQPSAAAGLAQVRWRRRWVPGVVAGAAAATVFLAIGLPILMLRGDDSVVVLGPSTTADPIVTTVPSMPVAPIATTVPPVNTATPMTWGRIDNPAAFGGERVQRMVDVARGDGIVVAVGSDWSGRDSDAAAWYSFDGRAWNRVPHDEAVFGGDGHQQIRAVAAVGSGFVAVGTEGDDATMLPSMDEPSESFETHAAVWHSDDGITWSRAPHHDALSGGDGGAVMNDVAHDGIRLVAVGAVYHGTEPFAVYGWEDGDWAEIDTDVDAAVWQSDDGVTWTRVVNESDVFGGDTMRHRMNAVVAGGPGFVAVGIEGFDYTGFAYSTPYGTGSQTTGFENVTENAAAVWTSPDGETWTRVVGEPSLSHSGGDVEGWATMVDIVATDAGLVAVGRDSWDPAPDLGWRQFAAVWRSFDGLSWYRSGDPGELGYADMRGVTATGNGYVVGVGRWYNANDVITARMWSSQDNGDTWFQIWGDDKTVYGGKPESSGEAEAFGPASIEAVTSLGGGAIAVGHMGDDAAVWVGVWK